jgi:hypothetical protein
MQVSNAQSKIVVKILFFIFCCSINAFAQIGDTLCYDKQPKLTWQDFKTVTGVKSDSTKAFLSVTIQMRLLKANVWMGYGTYDADAIVFRSSSWVKDGAQDSLNLRHQQYAFILTELVASRLKQEVNEAKINLRWQKKIEKMFAKYESFARECLDAYRRETQNGGELQKQAEWEASIDRKEIKLKMPTDK